MKKTVLSVFVYAAIAAVLAACSGKMQERAAIKAKGGVGKGTLQGASDTTVTRGANGSIIITTQGLKFEVNETYITKAESNPVCQDRMNAAPKDAKNDFFSIKVAGRLSTTTVTADSNLEGCSMASTKNDASGNPITDLVDGVAQTSGNGYFVTLFTGCSDTNCTYGYGRMVLMIMGTGANSNQISEQRECGFQILNGSTVATVAAICKEKGQSFGNLKQVACEFDSGGSECAKTSDVNDPDLLQL